MARNENLQIVSLQSKEEIQHAAATKTVAGNVLRNHSEDINGVTLAPLQHRFRQKS